MQANWIEQDAYDRSANWTRMEFRDGPFMSYYCWSPEAMRTTNEEHMRLVVRLSRECLERQSRASV